MNLLILGGTGFVGPHLARAALAAGHRVTLFHRGRTPLPADLAEAAEGGLLDELLGDRDPKDPSECGGLSALEGERRWDAVVDLSGYVPRVVGASADLLVGRAGLYLFVSTISVYASPVAVSCDEDAPLATMEDPTSEEVMAHYGALKALSEERVREAFGERALVVRPGLIVGPGDLTDRFTSWVWLAAHAADELAGRLPAPGDPADRTQVIDARDLTDWMVHLCEEGAAGTVHASGPHERCTIGDLIEACLAGTDSGAEPVWMDADFLAEQDLSPWSDLPCWLPTGHDLAGVLAIDLGRARALDLACRPLVDTVSDTLAWVREDLERRKEQKLRAGLTVERAGDLLAAWALSSGC